LDKACTWRNAHLLTAVAQHGLARRQHFDVDHRLDTKPTTSSLLRSATWTHGHHMLCSRSPAAADGQQGARMLVNRRGGTTIGTGTATLARPPR